MSLAPGANGDVADIHRVVDGVYRAESRRVLATLIRLLGDFDIAEEALHDAFIAAVEQWPREGVPGNPRAWLVSTGRFKAIDGLRRRKRFDALDEAGDAADVAIDPETAWEDEEAVEDDRLRLIFTCCHPALAPEAQVALMLLHDSRRAARTSSTGELILLDDQDRSLWNREQIAEGTRLTERALRSRRSGPYAIQAAISAVHADAPSAAATDWAEIVGLYDVLARTDPSPVIELNRAVAVAMRDGPAAGLALVDAILARGELTEYYLAHAARADLCRRLGRREDAIAAYQRALALTRQEPERRFLGRRLAEL